MINARDVDPEFPHLEQIAAGLLDRAQVMSVGIRSERTVGHAFDKELALAFEEELGNGTDATRRRWTHSEPFLTVRRRGRKDFARRSA